MLIVAGLLQSGANAQTPERVAISRIAGAPKFESLLKEETLPAAVAGMTRVEGLVQRIPKDGAPVSERTVVYIGYEPKNIHVVFVCYDRSPDKIRVHMLGRDRIPDEDDSVAFQFDTFGDRKHAYGFQVNALGVQQDGTWSEDKGWDLSWDTIWNSQGRMTSFGYVVMITIPFKSIRFPAADAQKWLFLFFRGIPRNNNENSFYPAYSTRIAGRLTQAAPLTGIEKVSPGRNIQLIPYLAGRAFRALDTRDPLQPGFAHAAADLRAGVDAKMVIHDSLVLDATVNPDFSQVESDSPQVTANQRFEVFFPEKRVFFLENANYFDTPINLLFTRRIAEPQFGTRLTGKLGSWGLGALVVDDRSPGHSVLPGDPLYNERALFSTLRVNRDLFRDSSVGVSFVSRTLQDAHNFVGSVDTRLRLNANWIFTGQAVTSSTQELGGATAAGPAYYARLARSGRKFNYSSEFNDRSPGYRAEAGFTQRVDIRSLDNVLSYRFRPEGRWIVSWGPDLSTSHVFDHTGLRLDEFYAPGFTVEFGRQTTFYGYYSVKNERLRTSDFSTLASNTDFREHWLGFDFTTNPISLFTFTASFSAANQINFVPAAGQAPYLANATNANLGLTLRPTRALTVENTYLLTRLRQRGTGNAIFNDHIVRTKWTYQFTRSLSVRTILQYDGLLPNAALTSLENTKNLNADFLITWLPHPGTAVYVGYNSNLQNLDHGLALGPNGITRTRDDFINDGRQFFVKLSYLFRF